MKIKILISILALMLLFSGCATENAHVPQPDDLINGPVNIGEKIEYVKPSCTMTRVDGRCYLNFSDGNKYEFNMETSDGKILCVSQLAGICYESMHAFRDNVTDLDFGNDIETIKQQFYEGNPHGIEIIDPERLYVPIVPSDISIGNDVTWYGRCYALSVGGSGSMKGVFTAFTKNCYDDEFERSFVYYRPDDATLISENKSTSDEGKNEYIYQLGCNTYKTVQYKIETENKVLYVSEEYVIDSTSDRQVCSANLPSEVTVFGCENGAYFKYKFYFIRKPLSVEWISLLGAKPLD